MSTIQIKPNRRIKQMEIHIPSKINFDCPLCSKHSSPWGKLKKDNDVYIFICSRNEDHKVHVIPSVKVKSGQIEVTWKKDSGA